MPEVYREPSLSLTEEIQEGGTDRLPNTPPSNRSFRGLFGDWSVCEHTKTPSLEIKINQQVKHATFQPVATNNQPKCYDKVTEEGCASIVYPDSKRVAGRCSHSLLSFESVDASTEEALNPNVIVDPHDEGVAAGEGQSKLTS